MAIVGNLFLQNASGSIGKQLVFKRYYDKTVVSKMPNMSKRVLSEKQKESNERMRLATIYAKAWYKIEEEKIKARIRLKLPAHKSLFHALVKEHLDLHKNQTLAEIKLNFLSEFPVNPQSPTTEA
jgi:hypothetical protein